MSIPPEAVREASVMMKNGLVVSSILITSADRNVSLSLTKALSCSFPQLKGTPFLVRSMSGRAIVLHGLHNQISQQCTLKCSVRTCRVPGSSETQVGDDVKSVRLKSSQVVSERGLDYSAGEAQD